MFCRCCGSEVSEKARFCMKCGVPPGKGKHFCPFCGAATNEEAVACVTCGRYMEKEAPAEETAPEGSRSAILAGVLGLLLGVFGVHNFYLRRIGRGVAQALMWVYYVITYAGFFIFLFETVDSYNPIPIVIGVLLLISGILALLASGVWAFVESVLLLCGNVKKDGRGEPLKK